MRERELFAAAHFTQKRRTNEGSGRGTAKCCRRFSSCDICFTTTPKDVEVSESLQWLFPKVWAKNLKMVENICDVSINGNYFFIDIFANPWCLKTTKKVSFSEKKNS